MAPSTKERKNESLLNQHEFETTEAGDTNGPELCSKAFFLKSTNNIYAVHYKNIIETGTSEELRLHITTSPRIRLYCKLAIKKPLSYTIVLDSQRPIITICSTAACDELIDIDIIKNTQNQYQC